MGVVVDMVPVTVVAVVAEVKSKQWVVATDVEGTAKEGTGREPERTPEKRQREEVRERGAILEGGRAG